MSSPSSISHLQSSSNAAQSATLLDSFRIQLRVLHALFMREILTRFGRHNIGFLWLFAEPMILTVSVTALWTAMGAHKAGSGITITAFVLTGYSTVLLWRNMPGRCMSALAPNYSLLFHHQVKPLDIYASRLGLEVVAATTSFTVLTITFHAMDLIPLPHNYIVLWTGWLLLAWYAAAVSLIVGALSERSEVFEKFWHPAMYLLIPLSGSFFMVDALPPSLREAVLIIPTVHCAEMFRAGYFGPVYTWHYDTLYVVSMNMIFTLLGLSLVRTLRICPAN